MSTEADPPVLPYASPAPPAPPPNYRRMNGFAVLAGLLILCLFYIGLAPSVGSFAFDYTRDIPFTEAMTGVVRVPPRTVINDSRTGEQLWFIPLAIALLIAFVAVRRPAIKLPLAAAAILIPLFPVLYRPVIFLFLPLLGPYVIPAALFGFCDGEDWSEGFVAFGAMGMWMDLWIVLTAWLSFSLLARRRRARIA